MKARGRLGWAHKLTSLTLSAACIHASPALRLEYSATNIDHVIRGYLERSQGPWP